MLFIVSGCDYTEELRGDYFFHSEGSLNQVIVTGVWFDGDPYIPCNVEAYRQYKNFIVVRQMATEVCFWEGVNPIGQKVGQLFFWIIDVESTYLLTWPI